MSLKRTTVYADEQDLSVIKEAAAREGVSEAEIIREAIHLAAMAKRQWSEPFASATFPAAEDSEQGAQEGPLWEDRIRAYRRTRGDDL